VKMSGDEEQDRRQIQRAAGGPIDVVLRSDRIDLGDVTELALGKMNEAAAFAAANSGPFKMTVVRP